VGRLAGYTELQTLGTGGFGRVVLARHDASGTVVAIKYLHQRYLTDDAVLEGFRREATLMASVQSPYVVRLFDFQVTADVAALVMEAVPGVSLREMLNAERVLMVEAALSVLKGSLLGLAAAHQVGVVHRDYKPDNVLVTDQGVSKLVDFGLAVLDGRQGLTAGSPSYMAPEQWAGQPGTPATDVYAATCVFYQCVTGDKPFVAETNDELRRLHETAAPDLSRVPEHVRGLVAAGMAKSPHARPTNAEVFVTELERVAAAAHGPDWERRAWQALATAAGTLVALTPLAALAGTTTTTVAGSATSGLSALGAAGNTAGTTTVSGSAAAVAESAGAGGTSVGSASSTVSSAGAGSGSTGAGVSSAGTGTSGSAASAGSAGTGTSGSAASAGSAGSSSATAGGSAGSATSAGTGTSGTGAGAGGTAGTSSSGASTASTGSASAGGSTSGAGSAGTNAAGGGGAGSGAPSGPTTGSGAGSSAESAGTTGAGTGSTGSSTTGSSTTGSSTGSTGASTSSPGGTTSTSTSTGSTGPGPGTTHGNPGTPSGETTSAGPATGTDPAGAANPGTVPDSTGVSAGATDLGAADPVGPGVSPGAVDSGAHASPGPIDTGAHASPATTGPVGKPALAGAAGVGGAAAGGLLAGTAAKLIAAALAIAAVVAGGVVVVNTLGEEARPAAGAGREAAPATGCATSPPENVLPGVARESCQWQSTAEQMVAYQDKVVLVGHDGENFEMRAVDGKTGKQLWSTGPLPGLVEAPYTPQTGDAARWLRVIHHDGKPYAALTYTTEKGSAAAFMPMDANGTTEPVVWEADEILYESSKDDAVVFYDSMRSEGRQIDPESGAAIDLPVTEYRRIEAVGDGWFAEGTDFSFVVRDVGGAELWDPDGDESISPGHGVDYRLLIGSYRDYVVVLSVVRPPEGGPKTVVSVHDKTGGVIAQTDFDDRATFDATVLPSPNEKWLFVGTSSAAAAVNVETGEAHQLAEAVRALTISDDGKVVGVVPGITDKAVVADGNTGRITWEGDRETRLPHVVGEDYMIVNDRIHPVLSNYPKYETGPVWAVRGTLDG